MDREQRTASRIDERESWLSRRGAILSATAAIGAFAGCNSSGEGGDTETESTDDASTATETATPTTTETDTATDTETASAGFDVARLGESPSSHIAPADGFADVSWLASRDPEVVRVTTLDGNGEGSLRWALGQPGQTVVVFEVGGVVDLGGRSLSVATPNTYVAGQTAPSPGITIVRGGVDVNADNVILQHLRVRPGDDLDAPVDAIDNSEGSNLVVDHCSVSWGSDESLSTSAGGDNPNITYTNNLIAEGLADSVHPKGVHSMGTLVNDLSQRVLLAGNLWANSIGRHPRLKGGTSTAVSNNLMYNFERGTNLGGGVTDETTATIVGNFYKAGPDTPTEEPVLGTTFTDASGPIRAYVAFNATDPTTMQTTTPSTQISLVTERPLWPIGLETIPASEVSEAIPTSVGARPADRTPTDERILTHVAEGTGEYIDSQEEVGGYPDLEATERSLDVPDSGLAAWLHEHTVAVESA